MPGTILFSGEHKVIGIRDAFTNDPHIPTSYPRGVRCKCRYCLPDVAVR